MIDYNYFGSISREHDPATENIEGEPLEELKPKTTISDKLVGIKEGE